MKKTFQTDFNRPLQTGVDNKILDNLTKVFQTRKQKQKTKTTQHYQTQDVNWKDTIRLLNVLRTPNILPVSRCQKIIFQGILGPIKLYLFIFLYTAQGRGGVVKLGHSDRHLVKNSRRKDLIGKKFFLLDTLKTKFWTVNLK